MDYSNGIINQIINNFDFAYMVSVNVLTYLFIKLTDYFNGDKAVSIVVKRILLVLCIIIVGGIYIISGYKDYIVLINSSIVAPIAWSWIIRPIISKTGLGYKQNKN